MVVVEAPAIKPVILTSPEKKSITVVVNPANCPKCDKAVFFMEQVEAGGRKYHKTCFRCETCGKVVPPTNFGHHNSLIYCKPHYAALFKVKTDEAPINAVSAGPTPAAETPKPADAAPSSSFDFTAPTTTASDGSFAFPSFALSVDTDGDKKPCSGFKPHAWKPEKCAECNLSEADH